MRKMVLSLLGMLGLSAGGIAQEVPPTEIAYTLESLDDIKEKIENSSAVLLDVREQDEWDQGYIKQAQRIATSAFKDEATRADAVAKLDKSKPIYCHCKKGGRAMMISEYLFSLGYDIHPMRQAYTKIVASGFEEVKP